MDYKYIGKWTLGMIWAIPWCLAAVPCFIVVIAAPLGFVFIVIGTYPLYKLESQRANKKAESMHERIKARRKADIREAYVELNEETGRPWDN